MHLRLAVHRDPAAFDELKVRTVHRGMH